MTVQEQLALIKEHVAGQHPFLDATDCPVCAWTLKQHQQGDA